MPGESARNATSTELPHREFQVLRRGRARAEHHRAAQRLGASAPGPRAAPPRRARPGAGNPPAAPAPTARRPGPPPNRPAHPGRWRADTRCPRSAPVRRGGGSASSRPGPAGGSARVSRSQAAINSSCTCAMTGLDIDAAAPRGGRTRRAAPCTAAPAPPRARGPDAAPIAGTGRAHAPLQFDAIGEGHQEDAERPFVPAVAQEAPQQARPHLARGQRQRRDGDGEDRPRHADRRAGDGAEQAARAGRAVGEDQRGGTSPLAVRAQAQRRLGQQHAGQREQRRRPPRTRRPAIRGRR